MIAPKREAAPFVNTKVPDREFLASESPSEEAEDHPLVPEEKSPFVLNWFYITLSPFIFSIVAIAVLPDFLDAKTPSLITSSLPVYGIILPSTT